MCESTNWILTYFLVKLRGLYHLFSQGLTLLQDQRLIKSDRHIGLLNSI